MSKQADLAYFKFPETTGKYAVGSKSLFLVDKNRGEIYLPGANEFRELMITAWYPTDAKDDGWKPYAPAYLLNYLKTLFKSYEGVTEADCKEIETIRVPAQPDAPISLQPSSFPLVIFSHGYYGSRFYCSAFCQELASNGYIVIAIDHTYDAGITELPGGKIISWASLTEAANNSDEFYDTFNTRIDVRVADIRFLLDCVAKGDDPLFTHADLNNVGIFGHSLGAEAALQVAACDERIKAVVAMDPFPIGKSIASIRNIPCMILAAERTDWAKLECSEKVHAHIAECAKELQKLSTYHLLLNGADHVVFSDVALFSHMNIFKKLPANNIFMIGSIDGFAAVQLIDTHLVAFFGKTLKNEKQIILNQEIDNQQYKLTVK